MFMPRELEQQARMTSLGIIIFGNVIDPMAHEMVNHVFRFNGKH
jgi:hypothetical protein